VVAIKALESMRGGGGNLGKVADLGCGKLRHYKLLSAKSNALFLVDTPCQLAANHVDGRATYTIPQVVQNALKQGREVYALSLPEFAAAEHMMDVIFCVAVFDVVLRKTRRLITKTVAQKLKIDGHIVVIAPRNDASILRRCSEENAYSDGHVFEHHGLQTFFHNFRTYKSIVQDCANEGLFLTSDLSRYRQVCLIFERRTPNSIP
jgi:hypothetical protein